MKQLLVGLLVAALAAQEPTFRSETRVVTVDVMVRDTVTRRPVANLQTSDFRLRIDGKARPISYFGQEGTERRPLVMLVFFNLAPDGALRELSQPAALPSFAAALERLSPQDEVAVYATRDWFVGEAQEMTSLTRDRQAAAAALQRSLALDEATPEERRQERAKSMTSAVQRAIAIARQRPEAQVALVSVSDGMNPLDTMEAGDRRALGDLLEANNISLSALNLRMLGSYAAAAAVINPLGKVFGLSVTGSGNYLARQSGGVSVDVAAASEFGAALDHVVSAYASRYSLGYQVSEDEYRDGKPHRIEVQLTAKEKRWQVSARQSFVAGGR